ncbi:MAG TPA: carboxypeptidase-like regulatory domain-containing protein, partial [Vicinamibacterales bacterium]
LADGEGHFTFRDVPKGRFSLTATKTGYADGANGRLRPGGSSQSIDLADGQRVTDATVPLWKLGAIAGTVLDDVGEPLVGAPIGVLKRTFLGGQPQLTPSGGSVTTDDRGMYRLSSLEPGTYVVVLPITQDRARAFLAPGMPNGPQMPPPPPPPPPNSGALNGLMTQSFAANGNQVAMQSINGSSASAPARITADGQLLWYQTTFYPDALAAAKATPITIGPGEVRLGVDLALKPVRASLVAGVLSGPDGPPTNMLLTLYPADADGVATPVETATAVTNAAGHFEFPHVPVGQYTIRTIRQPRVGAPAMGGTTIIQSVNGAVTMRTIAPSASATVPPLPDVPTLWAESNLSVGPTDVSDVNLGLRNGLRATGRVVFDGSAAQPTPDQLPTNTIALDAADGRTSSVTSSTRGRIDSNGQFTTLGVPPGRYVLRLGTPSGWTVRGAIYNGRDIADHAVEIAEDLEGITVTFTDKTTALTGTVTSSGGLPDPKAAVIVFPSDPTQWVTGPSPRRLKNVRVGPDGSFSVNLPAGDY